MTFEKGNQIRKGRTPWNKDKTKETDKRVKKYSETLSRRRTRRTYNMRFGVERANEIKEKQRIKKVEFWKLRKRKNYDELYGIEKSKIIRKKQSYSRKKGLADGTIAPWPKGKKRSDDFRKKIVDSHYSKKENASEICKKISKSVEELWQDPEYREKQLKKIYDGLHITPNWPEQQLINIIQENNLPFNYVGNHVIWFRGETQSFNPDFLSKNPKYIIELFGDYWHNLPEHVESDKERLSTYTKYGYKTLVIWQHELKKPNLIIKKIKEFIAT